MKLSVVQHFFFSKILFIYQSNLQVVVISSYNAESGVFIQFFFLLRNYLCADLCLTLRTMACNGKWAYLYYFRIVIRP